MQWPKTKRQDLSYLVFILVHCLSTKLTLVRGIRTFLGIGNPTAAAYCWAATSFAWVKRVPSTKRANQKGKGKSFSPSNPDCNKTSRRRTLMGWESSITQNEEIKLMINCRPSWCFRLWPNFSAERYNQKTTLTNLWPVCIIALVIIVCAYELTWFLEIEQINKVWIGHNISIVNFIVEMP